MTSGAECEQSPGPVFFPLTPMHPLSETPESRPPAGTLEAPPDLTKEAALAELLSEMHAWHVWRASSTWLPVERRNYHTKQAAAILERLRHSAERAEARARARARVRTWEEFCASFRRPL